jgi:hypothetical protein
MEKSFVASLTLNNDHTDLNFGQWEVECALNLHKLIHKENNYRGEFQISESISMCP